MVNKLRLGVIGTGAVFESMHLPALNLLTDKFEVVALCNHNVQKAEKFTNTYPPNKVEIYSDYLMLLQEEFIDVVLITVPIHLNASIAMDAISSGKHVFLEKPLADNLEQAGKLVELSKCKNRKLFIGEIIRYRPQYRQAHDLMNTGIIGTPKLYRMNDLHFTYPGGIWDTEWRKKSPHQGGYILDGGPHIIAGMREVIQSDVISLRGHSLSFHPELFSDQPETLLMDLEFKNGILGQLCIGCGAIDRDARRPKIYGPEGTLVIEKDHIHVWYVEKDREDTSVKFNKPENELVLEWEDFYNEIVLDQTPHNSLQKAYEDVLILLKCLQSAKENRRITL